MPATTNKTYATNHAGLVLLWPFMHLLFERLGLAMQFNNPAHRQKAVRALLFAATGQDAFSPQDAEAVGLMFGLDLTGQTELPPLTAPEKELVESMLQAAISRWDKMRNTSTSKFREAFLIRPGKLTIKKDQIMLVVEEKGYDILLQMLPWSIGMIKLSWMPMTCYVEW